MRNHSGSGEDEKAESPEVPGLKPESEGPLRVAILTNILAPYRIPLFDELGSRDGLAISVFTMTGSQKNRSWESEDGDVDFSHSVLSGYSSHSFLLDRSAGLNPSIVPALREYDPDILILGGYSDVTSWLALTYAEVTGIPLVVWLGSWRESSRLSNSVATAVKKMFIRRADTWIAYGSRAAEWINTLGGDQSRVYQATNTVDTDRFRERATVTGTPPADDEPLALLYCGQLIPRKNVDVLLGAIRNMPQEQVHLTVVGDGPQRERLSRLASTVTPEVTFEGYVNREQLPRYYGSVDALVLPSQREVWGLVVNEALSCGAAAVVSEQCGCTADLIGPGFNGYCFAPSDTSDLQSKIERLAEQRTEFRRRRKQISQDMHDRASISAAADEFAAAVREAYKRSR